MFVEIKTYKMGVVTIKLYVILITYCKIFHPKNPFYEKVKMTTKKIAVLESFIIVGSFDYDCTQIFFTF
jgi:hypothetical protein